MVGVGSGIVMQGEDFIHLPVWPNPSNLFFNLFDACDAWFTCHDAAVILNKSINLSLVSIITAMAVQLLQGLSPVSFSLVLKQRAQHLS